MLAGRFSALVIVLSSCVNVDMCGLYLVLNKDHVVLCLLKLWLFLCITFGIVFLALILPRIMNALSLRFSNIVIDSVIVLYY